MSPKKQVTGYEVVGVSTPTQVVPEAEMLSRNDTDGGRWTIHSCSGQSGEAKTAVSERLMFVPTYDDEKSRHVRAHEMFHAKVSPTTQQYEKIWKVRKFASDRTLTACEELRVNTLMLNAGFEPHLHLTDGSEKLNGIQMATHNDFQASALASISLANTAGLPSFLEGVSLVHPEWIPILTKLTKESVAMFQGVGKHNLKMDKEKTEWRKIPELNALGDKPHSNGFGYTEALARWVEEMIGVITDPETQKRQGKKQGEGKGKDGKDGEVAKLVRRIGKAGKQQREKTWVQGNIPRRGTAQQWETLVVATPMLVRNVIGAIGKKRVATDVGRNPRRISRLLTDPQRRIFDRIVKGQGGVVLVDTSGSMCLSQDDVKALVTHAPSALVAMYSGGGKPNLWVIANKGKMVQKLPHPHGSNGVDFPALVWAIKKRQRVSSPVIWVSDGYVTGKGDTHTPELIMDCIRLCKKHGVYVVPTPDDAIELLKRLQRREKITSIVPEILTHTYRDITGHTLVLR